MEISGKELIIKTFQHQKTERIPWVPYTGIHVGCFENVSAEKLLKDEDLLFNNLMHAYDQYSPDGMPVVFDLQIEAEILGCELMWAEKAPPSVRSHPLSDKKEIDRLLPSKEHGRLPIILNVMKRIKEAIGDKTALYGLICGPLTLASHLRGMELFMDMYEDEKFVHSLINYSTEVFNTIADYYIEAGMDIVASVDPIVSQISPSTFQQYLSEPYKEIFKNLRNKNVFNGFFVCGDATKNLDVMCKTNPDSISIDENIDIVEAKKITDKYNIVISGNIPLTTVMLLGSQKDNQKYAIELSEKIGNDNFILAPGCDMPYDVPKENIIGIAQAVHDPVAIKNYLIGYKREDNTIAVSLPDYSALLKPLVEVYTIDSATCAACGYMTLAALEMEKIFGDKIEIIERKITDPENVARLGKIGIKNLPTLLINGQQKFISIIPKRTELQAEIEKYL